MLEVKTLERGAKPSKLVRYIPPSEECRFCIGSGSLERQKDLCVAQRIGTLFYMNDVGLQFSDEREYLSSVKECTLLPTKNRRQRMMNDMFRKGVGKPVSRVRIERAFPAVRCEERHLYTRQFRKGCDLCLICSNRIGVAGV